MNKLKAITRSVSFSPSASTSHKNNRNEKDKMEAVVGFKLLLHDEACGPELEVQLIGARHLPSIFGLKKVEGYQIKVKLFPGNAKFDSGIQTSSWPKINENFRFPMKSSLKSSLKSKQRDFYDMNGNESLPVKLFKGTFVVFTVVALLEIPDGAYTGIKGTYQNFKRQGSLIIRDRMTALSNLTGLNGTASTKEKNKEQTRKLPISETQRNIGVVTYFLNPKDFEENSKNRIFSCEEMWLPIKDITVAPNPKLSVQSSPKGQVEMILELCDSNSENKTDEPHYDKNLNPFECEEETEEKEKRTSKSRLSFSNVKLPDVAKRFIKPKKSKNLNGLCLKITTSKMRCSLKVKEEFESDATQIYVKTTVFEHEILSETWKSELFAPTLSTRWDHIDSTICIPLVNESSLDFVTIKTTIATKTKLGKKIVLGVIYIRPDMDDTEHWSKMITMRNTPIPMWYSFE